MSNINHSTKPEKNAMAPVPTFSFFNPRRRRVIQARGEEPTSTKQEFKNDCDINQILKKYQRTGAISHFAKYAPQYGEFNPCDLQEAHDLIKRARKMFDDLPSSIRKEVQTPEGFLTFVQDPSNKARMAELGLTKAPPAATIPPPAEAK